ncbi:MAG: hypothetical protein C4547_01570 [Phycisphaerales bacterium]|nr:MAG: hypothetical protein C4547_01570 [Phycisphaerales bacterium]
MSPDALIPCETVPPYTLPLTIEQFEAALRTGHGRAWQHAVDCGVADRLDAVVYACMHNLAYDAQCEGDRADWMLALVEAAGVTNLVTPLLLQAGNEPPDQDEGFWHAVQRCRVMLELAKRGEDAARALLYQSFRPNGETMDLIGCAEILELDGADGLIFVCQKLGQWIAQDASRLVDDQPLWKFDERAQPGVAARLLKSVRWNDPDIARYLDAVSAQSDFNTSTANTDLEPGAAPSRPRRLYKNLDSFRFDDAIADQRMQAIESRSADDVIDWVRAAPEEAIGGWLRSWGRRAPEQYLMKVADALADETHPPRLCKFLLVFQRRAIPIVTDALLRLAEHPTPDVRWLLNYVLSHVADPRVRELALRCLTPERMLESSLLLFRSNLKPGDAETIERALFLPDDPEGRHGIILDLLKLFEKQFSPESARLMLFAYEHSPCGNCRVRATKVLAEIGAVPEWLAEECRFDAMEELRERFAKET